MFRRSNSTLVLLLLVLVGGTSVLADSWGLPSKRQYYSSDRKYRLNVIPKKLESVYKYFQDKVKDKPDAGAVKGLRDNRAKGIFYVRESSGYKKKLEFPLVNEVAPVSALVSDDGNYIVTFDNWHAVGYGDDVVVIYKSDGKLIKKFGLEDLFTKADIQTFSHSVSSIWWGIDHYIDNKKGILYLKAARDDEVHELGIELATGRPLEPKRDLFLERQEHFKVSIEPADAPANPTSQEPRCLAADVTFDVTNALRISSEQLRSKLTTEILPPYPAIAKAASAEGKVIVEVLVLETGEVICVRVLSGHPLLVSATIQAVRQWKFDAFKTPEGVSRVVGTIAVTFKLR